VSKLRAVLANTVWIGGARMVQAVVAFGVGVYMARHLGPASSGVLAYAASFVGLFAGVAALGLDTIVVRELSQRGPRAEDPDAVVASAFVLRVLGSAAGVVLTALAVVAFEHDRGTIVLIAVSTFSLVLRPLSVIELYFQARLASKHVVLVQLVALGIASAIRLVAIALGAPLVVFALAVVVETAVAMLGFVLAFRSHIGRPFRFAAPRGLIAKLFSDAWPLALTSILIFAYLNADRVIVRSLLDERSVGLYGVSISITTTIQFLPMALGQSAFPTLIEARSDPVVYDKRLQGLMNVLLWGAIAFSATIALLAGFIVERLYGANWSAAATVLRIYVWGAPFTVMGMVASYWLVAENLQRFYPLRVLASLVCCVGLDFALIPRLGLTGAAVGALVAQLLSSTGVFLLSQRTRLMPLMQLRAVLFPVRWLAQRFASAEA